MSQGTPAKESRVERHLMRQRGAGVRAITADFGFSFDLPAPTFGSVASVDPPIEPPAKRRRTTQVQDGNGQKTQQHQHTTKDRQRAEESLIEPARNCPPSPVSKVKEEGETGTNTQAKPTRKPYRKLQLEDDAKADPKTDQDAEARRPPKAKSARQPRTTVAKKPSTKRVDDTFIFGVKLKKRQTKKEQLEKAAGEVLSEEAIALPCDQLAGETTQTLKESTCRADKLPPIEETEIAKPVKATQSKPVAKKATKSTVTPDLNIEATQSPATEEALDHKRLPDKPKKVTKAKAYTKRSNKATATTEITTKPPENITTEVDKSPKESTKTAKPKKSKKVADSGTLPIEDMDELSFSTADAPTHAIASTKQPGETIKSEPVTKKKPARSPVVAETKPIDESNASEVPQVAARRPRRQAAISAKEKVATGYEEELVPVDKLRRAPDPVAKIRRPKKAGLNEASPTEEVPPQITKAPPAGDTVQAVPAKVARKTTSKSANTKSTKKKTVEAIASETEPVGLAAPTTQKAPADICKPEIAINIVPNEVVKGTDATPAPKKRRVLAESDVNISRPSPARETSEKPVKDRKAHITDEDDVPKVTVKPSRRQKSTKKEPSVEEVKPAANLPGDDPKAQTKSSKRTGKPQRVDKANFALDIGSVSDQQPSPKKRKRTAADEDLDWLFDKPEVKHVQPAILRPSATKARRKMPDQAAKDMDLDDLLESIAGFSGKLLTGRNGRVR
ncbi:hypothetical protein Q7P37_007141 [Cladosporium fusiforme]